MHDRLFQITLVLSTLLLCWIWMMIVHEFGHVLMAWTCGETITKVVLHPLAISRTDTTHDKHPLLVIWGGPVLGSLIPLAALLAAHFLRFRFVYLCRFFAGFCLISNGAYLGVGSFASIGDAGDLARAGCPQSVMIVFGVVCSATGLWLWNGLGPHFGLNQAKGKVDRSAALAMPAILLITVIVELLASSR
jgi:Peptidase M50B-like